ncbi:MAG: hypothetical protein M3Q75_06755 [Gemmatimonadota bacterium]|nr:hypothetical protein [Gemmatimonadota bacterium]
MSRLGNRSRGRGRAVLAATATAATGQAGLAPANSRLPLTVAELNTITASPGTAWTAGQYMNLFNGTQYKWGGAAWVAFP